MGQNTQKPEGMGHDIQNPGKMGHDTQKSREIGNYRWTPGELCHSGSYVKFQRGSKHASLLLTCTRNRRLSFRSGPAPYLDIALPAMDSIHSVSGEQGRASLTVNHHEFSLVTSESAASNPKHGRSLAYLVPRAIWQELAREPLVQDRSVANLVASPLVNGGMSPTVAERSSRKSDSAIPPRRYIKSQTKVADRISRAWRRCRTMHDDVNTLTQQCDALSEQLINIRSRVQTRENNLLTLGLSSVLNNTKSRQSRDSNEDHGFRVVDVESSCRKVPRSSGKSFARPRIFHAER